jgi:hypothetical protein
MNYSQYQVWFHAYNSAIGAFAQRSDINPVDVSKYAEGVADKAYEKFKNVKMPETPAGLEGIDLQGLVNSVAKKATSK